MLYKNVILFVMAALISLISTNSDAEECNVLNIYAPYGWQITNIHQIAGQNNWVKPTSMVSLVNKPFSPAPPVAEITMRQENKKITAKVEQKSLCLFPSLPLMDDDPGIKATITDKVPSTLKVTVTTRPGSYSHERSGVVTFFVAD